MDAQLGGLRLAPLALALGLACADDPSPILHYTRRDAKAAIPTPIAVDPAARYYRSFDPLTLTGLDELDPDELDYPYVAIERSDDGAFLTVRGEMRDPAKDSDCRFEMLYERRGDVFVKREIYVPLEKGYDYTEEVCHVHAAQEFCYFYLRQHDSTPEDPDGALYIYTHENRQEKVEWHFTIWYDKAKIVRDTIEFTPTNPLPRRVRRKSDLMEIHRYSRNAAGEIETATHTDQWFDDEGKPGLRETYPATAYERLESIPQFYLRLDDLYSCIDPERIEMRRAIEARQEWP